MGLKLLVGCAGNNLFVFEVDTCKRIKDVKSTNIIYCFMQLNNITVLCGQRDGHVQIIQVNNFSKTYSFSFDNTSHIIQVSKSFTSN